MVGGRGDGLMDISLSDERIAELVAMPKRVTNPKARQVPDAKHLKCDYKVVSVSGDDEFTIFIRQHSEMLDDFTAGLKWHSTTGEAVILMRCNGASHPHKNHVEGTRFSPGNYHIHKATERYIEKGYEPEHFAEVTNGYTTVEGALHRLCVECNISGIDTTPESLSLFPVQ
jgi:hypothetical protein